MMPSPWPEKAHSDSVSGLLWAGLASLLGGAGLFLLLHSSLGLQFLSSLDELFALSTVQLMWYITRASGLMAYVLLWLSTAWGLAVSSKILDRLLHRTFTYDYHQVLSLLAVGFLLLHMGVLLFDRYMPYSLPQILVPLISPYRPLWVGVGVVAFYLIVLVTVTFYLRGRIGMRAFRAIHVLSLVGYLGGLAHSVMSGTDSVLLSTQLFYAGTFLVTFFLLAYWVLIALQRRLAGVLQPARVPSERR